MNSFLVQLEVAMPESYIVLNRLMHGSGGVRWDGVLQLETTSTGTTPKKRVL